MLDIFLQSDIAELLKKKSVVFMGDSNIRALYKDFLCLLHETKYISQRVLKTKMENTVFGDKLVFHGPRSNGRCYREEREATVGSTSVSFFFLTRVYDDYVRSVLDKISHCSTPDIIVINCCLWDITRWGCDGVEKYKQNLKYLMKKFKSLFPNALIIWLTAPPIAGEVNSGFLVKELQFLKYSLRFHVVEANHYARKVVVENGFDLLDTHYHLKMEIHRRSPDGIHWIPEAVRYITNLLLTHISLAWNVPLPHRYKSSSVEENLLLATQDDDCTDSAISKQMASASQAKCGPDEASPCTSKSEKVQSAVVAVEKKKSDRKRRASLERYKVPKRGESIFNHMSQVDKNARHKRIRRWRRQSRGDSSQSCAVQSPYYPYPDPNYNSSVGHVSYHTHPESQQAVFSSSPFPSSRRTLLSFISPSQIPLLPHPCYNEPQPANAVHSFRSNNCAFPPIFSPNQMPLPPNNPFNSNNRGMPNYSYGMQMPYTFPDVSRAKPSIPNQFYW